jgi:hypothetical protein
VIFRVPRTAIAAVALCSATLALAAAPPPAAALNPVNPICTVAGWVSGIVGKACGVLQKGGRIVKAGGKLLSGHPGQAAKALFSGGVSKVGVAAGLTAVGVWVVVGAKTAVTETAKLIDHTTSPQLQTTWFSSTYWRMAGIAAVLTLPFLFAAAVQAVMRSDLALLARAALGYLPLAVLAVSVAAPLTMLLLATSDQMSAIVSSAAGGNAARALDEIGGGIGVLSTVDGSPFLAFLLGLLLAGGAFALWLELLVREAAVYVVVLMLPLTFAAFVWPARRVWAVRAVELLIALILAKFAIVAVLTLAAAGLGHKLLSGPTAMLSGLALVTLAAFAPWALLRLLPMAEVASAAAGSLRREAVGVRRTGATAEGRADLTAEEIEAGLAHRDHAGAIHPGSDRPSREAAQAHTDGFAAMPEVPAPAPAAAATIGWGTSEDSGTAEDARTTEESGSSAGARAERTPGMAWYWQHPENARQPFAIGREGVRSGPDVEPLIAAPELEPSGRDLKLATDLDPPGPAPQPPALDSNHQPPDPDPQPPGVDVHQPPSVSEPLPPPQEPEEGPL